MTVSGVRGEDGAMTPEACPEREHHGNPFRYCPVKGCGWIEEATTAPEDPILAAGRAAIALALAWKSFWAAVQVVEETNRATSEPS